ncbi:succinylglutamate desuccinylase/aspartoacylase family protein [uncultured Microbulbifer sp.]|uniref:succinylglutamate desuccinylase/aspartoacylase family protein n=1 Tax=uncultured Microbulbifer sp. TaxID=348147 RepID=UPI0025F9EF4C|nr:succinylglutamate desuccinylase/aspartoacylase family protein [uncultured Microbulbifer sp.]
MLSRSLSSSLLLMLCFASTNLWAEESPQQNDPEPVTADEQQGEDTDTAGTPEPEVVDQAAESTGDDTPMPKAKSIELDKPVSEKELATPPQEPPAEKATKPAAPKKPKKKVAPEVPSEPQKPEGRPLRMLGAEVPPATSTRLAWSPSQHFEGVYSSTPVLVVNGAEPGPTLCITAAIHGDELNGIETVRRVMYNLDPNTLKGAVIGVPIVNLQGFHRGSRYLTDRRDLNRHFPGNPRGSSASRIANSFFNKVIKHCSAIVDLHTGSFYRTNLPQLRGDLRDPKVVKLTKGFGSTVVLHSNGAKGTLRRSAVEAGIPTVTLEAGAPMVLDELSVSHSVKGIRTLLNQLDMVSKFRLWGDPEPVYYNSTWQRATNGGIIFSNVHLGQVVSKGDLLGTVTNPITNVRKEIRSQYDGRVLGMAMNQVVQPGFAAYHIGIQAPQEQISPPEEVTAEPESTSAATDATKEPSPEPQPASSTEAAGADENAAEKADKPADQSNEQVLPAEEPVGEESEED